MADPSPTQRKAKLQFHYIKGPDYREVTCHGVIGGLTPNARQVCLSVYSERGPIPRMVQFEVDVSDGGEIKFDETSAVPSSTDTRHGVVRHVEYTMYFDLEVARNLRKWLDDRIKALEGAA